MAAKGTRKRRRVVRAVIGGAGVVGLGAAPKPRRKKKKVDVRK